MLELFHRPLPFLADVQVFNANAVTAGVGWVTWAKRRGVSMVQIICIAGGGGGGGGFVGAASAAGGGAGGGSAGQTAVTVLALRARQALPRASRLTRTRLPTTASSLPTAAQVVLLVLHPVRLLGEPQAQWLL